LLGTNLKGIEMRLSNTTKDVKLTITHRPSKVLTQGQLNKKVAQELATRWSAKYNLEVK
jgi:hypothetical protein